MKKHFSFLLLLFISSYAWSQMTTSVKAGLALANLEVEGDDNMQVRIVGYGGLSFNVPLAGQLFLQPEVLYSMRGYSFRPNPSTDRHKVYFGYITAPVLLGYQLTDNFSIVAGPEFGYQLSARYEDFQYSTSFYENVTRKFNVDVDAGVAWNIISKLKLEARINFGVTPIYRGVLYDQTGTAYGELKTGFHRVAQFGLALAL